ncbi:ABC transporter ATP-binding protein [Radicibacter daui]|uniref:ABC transporter ATP-binding protein n=1 Tax=Radicibacter daui TaxID=3064829 RepID=UPI0040470156
MSATGDLSLDSVSKVYGETVAVDGVSFSVPRGSYVVLLGPSGSGKTTVLSMLGGFAFPSAGTVRINGQDVTHLPPARRPTATVFQDYALFPHLTVAGNVGFGLSVRRLARAEIRSKVLAALDLVGLSGFGDRAIAATSGGQRQRIALARAMVVEPEVLLLDEPLGALDLNLRRQMQEELRRIQRVEERTFVHVTHDQEEAMAIADVIVIMNRGRIEDIGAPERVYAAPRTRFSATFMGESTLIEGRVTASTGARVQVESPLGLLELPGKAAAGAKVTVAVRPENVTLADVGADGAGGGVPLGEVSVEDCIFQGSFVRLAGRTAAGLGLKARIDPSRVPAAGERVALRADPARLILLED